MKIERIKNYKIKVIPNSTHVPIQVEEMPTKHFLALLCAKRGSGKSNLVGNLMDRYQGSWDIVKAICPTIESNYALYSNFLDPENDVYENANDSSLIEFIDMIENEKLAYERYEDDWKSWKMLQKELKIKNASVIDPDLLMKFYDEPTDTFIKPYHEWSEKTGGEPRKPDICLIVDDCMCNPILNGRLFRNFIIRHRHVHGIGTSVITTCQAWRAQGGVPRVLRTNATFVCIWKTQNPAELKTILEECSGEVSPDIFATIYDYATKESKHDFLLVDFHAKKEHPSAFRKNLDEFIIPDNIKG